MGNADHAQPFSSEINCTMVTVSVPALIRVEFVYTNWYTYRPFDPSFIFNTFVQLAPNHLLLLNHMNKLDLILKCEPN